LEETRSEQRKNETFRKLYIGVPSYHCERVHFFAYRKWGRCAAVGEVDDDDDDDDIRFCARIRIAIVSIVCLPPSFSLVPVLHFFFFFLVRCPLESIPLDSFLTLAVGRSIATSADSALLRFVYLLVFPIYFAVQN